MALKDRLRFMKDKKKVETPKVPGKTYHLTKEERKLMDQYLGLVNIQSGLLHALQTQIRQLEMGCKKRCGIDPYTHAMFDYAEGTFFVPEIKPPDVPSQPRPPTGEKPVDKHQS